MILVIGGAWQGKLAFAKKRYGLSEEEITYCTQEAPLREAHGRCISGLHLALLGGVCRGEDMLAEIRALLPAWKDKIVLCDDIACGVVPMEAQYRQWRETAGHVLALLAENADECYRLFCGMELRLK